MAFLWPVIVLYGSTQRHSCMCTHTHMHFCTHKCACTHTFMDAHQCAHTDTCTHRHMYVHAHFHTCLLMYCSHAHDLTYTHTHIYMHSRMLRIRSISNTPCFSPQRFAERRSGLRTASCPCPWCCLKPRFSLLERLFFSSPCSQLTSAYSTLQQGGSTGYFCKDQISGEWGRAEGIISCFLCCTTMELIPDWIPQQAKRWPCYFPINSTEVSAVVRTTLKTLESENLSCLRCKW